MPASLRSPPLPELFEIVVAVEANSLEKLPSVKLCLGN